MEIRNWEVIAWGGPYQAPELMSTVITGEVYGHPGFEEGKYIYTSAVQVIDMKNKRARTLNSVYSLGEPAPGFLEWLGKQGKKLEDYHSGEVVL